MYRDLKNVSRPSRKKPGMKEFFILVLCYSYYNRRATENNEFALSHKALADYFNCTTKTIYRWMLKLMDLGYIKYAERENAGKIGYYYIKEDGKSVKKSYTIPKYKKIRVGEPNEIKFVNIYQLDQKGLNEYFKRTIDLDVFGNIESYKLVFDNYIKFLDDRHPIEELLEIAETDSNSLTKEHKDKIKRNANIEQKIIENKVYLDKKAKQDKLVPEFQCKYLREGCLRLTHELCNTVNPEHTDKINETNYWRSSHARNDILSRILKTTDFEEKDINGSIYRLTYNLFHEKQLDIKTDIYQLIWKHAFDTKWPTEQYRYAFKKLLMPIYMREYTMSFKLCRYDYIDKYYYGHPIKYKKLPKSERDQFELLRLFVDLLKMDIHTIIDKIKNAMHIVLNTTKFIGADIFIQESNLHILIKEKLLNKKIVCANIYDGFYFKKGIISDEEFYNIYSIAIQELKDNLVKGIGTPVKTI